MIDVADAKDVHEPVIPSAVKTTVMLVLVDRAASEAQVELTTTHLHRAKLLAQVDDEVRKRQRQGVLTDLL